jgi:ubiquinone/menaquinone biosynthesis C-methylase UbiE
MAATTVETRSRDDRHFERWSRRYDRSLLQSLLFDPVQRSVVAVLVRRLQASARVLDIGCGTGRLLDRIHADLPLATLVGIDRSIGMVQAARRLRPHLEVEQGSAEAIPHPEGCFDAVVTTMSFHHWSDYTTALSEVFRVLRPGGVFALTDASVDDLPGWPARLWALARRSMSDMPPVEERNRMVEGAGLRVIEATPTLHARWITLTLCDRPPLDGPRPPASTP